MALAKRDEGSKVSSEINVTPMVDVMLVLLIIFMVVTPMLQKGISVAKVNNPEQMPDADKEDALLVSITRDGKVYFGSEQVQDVNNLTTKVKDRLASRSGDRRVYVKADMRARFGGVVQVVDAVRAAGVDDLGLLTDQRKTTPNAPPPPAAQGQ
jgi:biopolymer transport protein TolR